MGVSRAAAPLDEAFKPDARQDSPDSSLIGDWSYCVVGRYKISRTAYGQMLFQERHTDGKEVSGILRSAENVNCSRFRWFQADIFAKEEFCGVLRGCLHEEQDMLITLFKLSGANEWGPEVCAQRLVETVPESARRRGGAFDVSCWEPLLRRPEARGAGCSGLARWLGSGPPSAGSGPPSAGRAEGSTHVAEVWELQRRAAPFASSWRAPFLPHDGWQGLSRWADKDFRRHPWAACGDEAGDAQDTPPLLAPRGWRLESKRWSPVRPEGVGDPEGWQYAVEFGMPESQWSDDIGLQCCRRRLWRCTVVRGPDEGPEEPQAEPAPGGLPLDASFDVLVREGVGPVPLEAEAERLLADDWGAGCFVVDLLRALEVAEVEVEPWLEDQGDGLKVRELSARVQCPPSPISPESSRARVRYEVHVEKQDGNTSIAIRATWSMLDVPYGDYFHTVEHMTLVPSGASVTATKAVKMDFVKSTMFQSMVETMTKAEAAKSAPIFVDLLRQRAKA